MPDPGQLEIAAHGLLTMLGVWLGLTVLARSQTGPGRLFAVLSLALATWSGAVMIDRLTTDPVVDGAARVMEEIALALAIPAVAHISVVVASPRRTSAQGIAIVLAYAANILVTLPAILDPDRPIRLGEPAFTLEPVPVAVLFAAWAAARLGTLLGTALWVLGQLRRAGAEPGRARQLRGLLATVGFATLGAALRVVPGLDGTDPWVGIGFVALAMLCAAWTVFATGVFLGPGVASRAFWGTVAAGAVVALLAAVLVAVDTVSRKVLGVDSPMFAVVALVAAAALYEPLLRWVRRRAARGVPRRVTMEGMLEAVGSPRLATQPSGAGVRPALERLAHTMGLAEVTVVTSSGDVIAAGAPGALPGGGATVVPLVAQGEHVGELRLDGGGSARPADRDAELLALAAHYLAAALRAGRIEDEQLRGLHDLDRERAGVDEAASELDAALAQHGAEPTGLRVFALGPVWVERGGLRVERWGGEKAGTRQAQALFAFLFDRGERGVAKDEALELIWPDVDLERADLAFHRTLKGLRVTLDPAGDRTPVRFRSDRYRLDPGVVAWSDVGAFLGALEEAGRTADPAAVRQLLADARGLYRGEYMDDCPIFGDSAFVEERRAALRARFADLMTAIGEASEARSDRVTASAAYRDALAASPDGNERAESGLARLG